MSDIAHTTIPLRLRVRSSRAVLAHLVSGTQDPGLLEYALARKVHIATPTTLVTMLRTAQYAWQQAALADNARAVFDLGRELYDRIGSLGRHVDQMGRSLTKTVSA